MSFSRTALFAAAVTLGSFAAVSPSADACPPSGGGGGYSRGYSAPSYRPSYNSYSAPSHSYSQPGYNNYNSYPTYSQPVIRSVQPQPIQSSPIIGQPVQQQSLRPVSQSQVVPQRQPQQQQLAPQTPQQRIAPQQQSQVAPQRQPQQQQLAQQQQQLAPTQQQQVAPRQQPVAPAAPQQNASMSALQALGGFAPPTTQPAPTAPQQTQTPAYVGNWSATLGNGATVRLALLNNGSFTWTATSKNGSSSSFTGTYTVSNGSLNLNRSNDGQTLAGSMTQNDSNAFSFKVAGNNAAGINFARS